MPASRRNWRGWGACGSGRWAWPGRRGDAAREFCRGLESVLVVEDRRSFLEAQLREALYAEAERPRLHSRMFLSDLANAVPR